jgi:hypothetical protein
MVKVHDGNSAALTATTTPPLPLFIHLSLCTIHLLSFCLLVRVTVPWYQFLLRYSYFLFILTLSFLPTLSLSLSLSLSPSLYTWASTCLSVPSLLSPAIVLYGELRPLFFPRLFILRRTRMQRSDDKGDKKAKYHENRDLSVIECSPTGQSRHRLIFIHFLCKLCLPIVSIR